MVGIKRLRCRCRRDGHAAESAARQFQPCQLFRFGAFLAMTNVERKRRGEKVYCGKSWKRRFMIRFLQICLGSVLLTLALLSTGFEISARILVLHYGQQTMNPNQL